MADMKMCRVCLRKDVKLFHYNGFQLKCFYEDILNAKIAGEDKLPRYFCFECAALLYKFHKFKLKCCRGQEILFNILKDTRVAQSPNVDLNIENNEVLPGLSIMTINKRVKTITIHRSDKLKDEESDTDKLKTEDLSETEEYSIEESDEDVCKKNNDVIKDILNDNSMDIDRKDDLVNNLFESDNKILVDNDDGVLSSDDDILSNLKNKLELNCPPKISDTSEVVKANPVAQSETKQKRVKAKKADKTKKVKQEVKRPKMVLESQYWERRQLTEEEAQEEFKKRATDPKYTAAAFQCTDCYKGFSQEDMLLRHNRKKHAESVGPVICKFCRCRFRIRCRLTRHLHQHYNFYKCLRCNLVCNLELSALLHEEHHNGVVKKCDLCGEEFTHTSTYYSHLRSHRSSFVCSLCGQSFVSAMGLRYHRTLKHSHPPPPKQSSKSDEGDKGVEATEGDEDDTYCPHCDIRFESQEAYDQHYVHSAMHSHLSSDMDCGEKWTDKAVKRRPRAPTSCPHCDTLFRTKSGFLKHPCMRNRAGAEGDPERGRVRERGRKRGRARGWVQMHPERKPQPNAKKEMCEICGATVGALYMSAHLNTHTHQKVYSCDVCGATMYSQSSQKRHQLTHTGERPYPCPLCDKRFTQSNSMKLHYRTFHLKEPYPKRNRKIKDDASLADFSALQNWSTDS